MGRGDYWWVNTVRARDKANELIEYADSCNDSRDHDEGHAAAAVIMAFSNRGMMPDDYIIRWIDGLI